MQFNDNPAHRDPLSGSIAKNDERGRNLIHRRTLPVQSLRELFFLHHYLNKYFDLCLAQMLLFRRA